MEAGTQNKELVQRELAEQIITGDFDALLVVAAKDGKVSVAHIGGELVALGLVEFAKMGILRKYDGSEQQEEEDEEEL